MPSSISELFPQLNQIKDTKLRQMSEKCWHIALERGGWDYGELENSIPFTLTLSEDVNISLAVHTRNVTDCAIAIGKFFKSAYNGKIDINMDYLISGAILHDVGKLLEYSKVDGKYVISEDGHHRRHPISGLALAAEVGLPEKVQHIIASHSWEGDKWHRSPEAYIVHHSDFVNYHPLKDR